MTIPLCCLISPSMACGFCNAQWCLECYDKLMPWPQDACSTPNTSCSNQGNHYTRHIDSTNPIPVDVRLLRRGEKVTDFD